MPTFQLPETTAIDSNGDVLGGAKLYFYTTGTSNDLTVYEEEALSTAHAQPVVADSAGRFNPIYLQTDKTYKVVLKTSADVEVYTFDGVKALAYHGDATSARLAQAISDPLTQGAVGDGAADESTEVQAAIDAATGTVDLLGKTYRCDSQLALTASHNGLTIKNGTLNFANYTTADECVSVTGTIGSGLNLSSDVDVGDTSVTISSTSGLSAGDLLWLSSSATFHGNSTDGEWVRVESVDSGTVLTLESKLLGSYTTANTGNVKKVTPAKDITFDDVEFVGATQTGQQNGLYLNYTENVRIENCKFDTIDASGVFVGQSYLTSIDRCTFYDLADSSWGDGVAISDGGARVTISDCEFTGVVDGVTVTQGPDASSKVCRNVTVSGCHMSGITSSGIVFGDDGEHCTAIGNEILCSTGSVSGIHVGTGHVVIKGNTIRNSRGTGITLAPVAPETSYVTPAGETPASTTVEMTIVCEGNLIELCDTNGIKVETAGETLRGVAITGNAIAGADEEGILLDAASGDITDVSITGNTISSTTHGINLDPTVDEIIRVSVSNNTVLLPGTSNSCIRSNGAQDVSVVGNSVSKGSSGINCTSNGLTVSGNTVKDSLYGISLTGSSATVSGNFVMMPSASGVQAIRLVGCSDVAISGNSIESVGSTAGEAGVYVDDSDGVSIASNTIYNFDGEGIHFIGDGNGAYECLSISGNTLRACGSAGEPAIKIETSGTSTLTAVALVGNTLHDPGDHGIRFEGVDIESVAISGCSIYSSNTTSGDDGISLAGDSAAEVRKVAISGCSIRGFDYSVGGSNVDDVQVDGCILMAWGNGGTATTGVTITADNITS